MKHFLNQTEKVLTSSVKKGQGDPNIKAKSIQLCKQKVFKININRRSNHIFCCLTNDGFKIAEADLQLRGPGNMEGTQQSGILNFKLADLSKDQRILQIAREVAARILDQDPNLEKPINARLKHYMKTHAKKFKAWSRIS